MSDSSPLNQYDRKKRNLKSTLVEPFKQIKLGLYVMVVTFSFVLVAGYFYRQAFEEQYAHVMEIFDVVEEATQEEVVVNDIFLKNRIKLAAVFIIFIAVMFTVIFRMTHKYNGPLVSIERFVQQIKDGHYDKRVSIRKGDELVRLTELLNSMAETLESRHGEKSGEADRRRSKEDGSEDDAEPNKVS